MSSGKRRQRRIKPVMQSPAEKIYPAGTLMGNTLNDLDQSWPDTRSARVAKRLPLMDDAHAFTFSTRLTGHGGTMPEAVLAVMRRYRMSLRRCEKFVLDDDAVRLTCEMSVRAQAKNEDLLRSWSYVARLPYENFWVEFNQHVRCRAFETLRTLRGAFDPSQVAQHVGYQFEMDTDDPGSPRWVVREFTRSPETGVLPGIFAFVFDPEATEAEPVRSSKRWRLPTVSDRPGMPRIPGQITVGGRATNSTQSIDPEDVILGTLEQRSAGGGSVNEVFVGLERQMDGHTIFAPRYLRAKLAVIVDPFWHAYFAAMDTTDERREKTSRILAQEVLEQAGTARWVITLLAMINAVPRDVVPVSVTPGRRVIGANVLPYFQHRTISIQLPRDDRVVHALQHVERFARERNAPRAWHEVRGHWRIIERGRVPLRGRGQAWCRHSPEATDESGTGLCGRCGLLIRWVKHHHRGDPNVGVVDHTYKVTARKRSAVR